jgi:hypothetical protein
VGGAVTGSVGPHGGAVIRSSRIISASPPVVSQTYTTGAPIVSGIRNSRIGVVGPTTITHVPPPPQYVMNSGIRGSRTILATGPPQMVGSIINQPPITTTTVTDTFTSGFRGNNTYVGTPTTMVGTPVIQPGQVTTVKEEIIETITPQQTYIPPQQVPLIPQQTYFGNNQVGVVPYPTDYGCWYRFSNACPRICGLPWWIPFLLGLLALGGLLTGLGYGYKAINDGNKVAKPIDNKAGKTDENKTDNTKPNGNGAKVDDGKEVSKGAKEEPKGDGAKEEPKGDGAKEEPKGDGAKEEPKGDGAKEEPKGDGAKEEPKGDGAKEEPKGDGAKEEPKGDGAKEEPKGDGAKIAGGSGAAPSGGDDDNGAKEPSGKADNTGDNGKSTNSTSDSTTNVNVTLQCEDNFFSFNGKCIQCPEGSKWNGKNCVRRVFKEAKTSTGVET